jgi:hypothetical protein
LHRLPSCAIAHTPPRSTGDLNRTPLTSKQLIEWIKIIYSATPTQMIAHCIFEKPFYVKSAKINK